MRNLHKSAAVIMLILSVLIFDYLSAAERPADYPFQPVPFTKVRFTDTFWQSRIETNRAVTIPFAFGKCEETNRIDNFKVGVRIQRHRSL